MSRIYFHFKGQDDCEIAGSERAHAGCLVDRLAIGALGLDYSESSLFQAIRPKIKTKVSYDWRIGLRTLGMDAWFELPDGQKIDRWPVYLNTALSVGSRPARLLVFLHAQCEIHLWVAGKNRAWLVEIIKEGLESGVMRKGLRGYSMGWPKLIEALQESDQEPVVTSYSVCDRFPNSLLSNWDPEGKEDDDGDGWYDLPWETQWDSSFESIQKMELTPEKFSDPRSFAPKLNGFDVLELLDAAQVEA